MPTPTQSASSHTLAIAVGALAAFTVAPKGPNMIAAPEVLPDTSGFVCHPFGEQFADGGFNELCRLEPQPAAGPVLQGAAPELSPGITYYETRKDGLWKCLDSGDLKPVCTLDKPAAKTAPPAKKGKHR